MSKLCIPKLVEVLKGVGLYFEDPSSPNFLGKNLWVSLVTISGSSYEGNKIQRFLREIELDFPKLFKDVDLEKITGEKSKNLIKGLIGDVFLS